MRKWANRSDSKKPQKSISASWICTLFHCLGENNVDFCTMGSFESFQRVFWGFQNLRKFFWSYYPSFFQTLRMGRTLNKKKKLIICPSLIEAYTYRNYKLSYPPSWAQINRRRKEEEEEEEESEQIIFHSDLEVFEWYEDFKGMWTDSKNSFACILSTEMRCRVQIRGYNERKQCYRVFEECYQFLSVLVFPVCSTFRLFPSSCVYVCVSCMGLCVCEWNPLCVDCALSVTRVTFKNYNSQPYFGLFRYR